MYFVVKVEIQNLLINSHKKDKLRVHWH